MGDTLKTIGNVCVVFLSIIAVIVSCVYGYFHFFLKGETTGTNYVDNQIGLDIVKADDLTEEQKDIYEDRYFMEANYYSNAKENGIALQELKFNYFTDYRLTSDGYRSTGMQYIGDLQQNELKAFNVNAEDIDTTISDKFTYYDTTNEIDWNGGKLATQLNRESTFVIKIDDRAFQIQLTGSKTWTETKKVLLVFNKKVHNTLYYNYVDVFADCMQAVRTNNKGFGDYYITVNLSDYFTIREFDTTTGQYKEDNVTDIIKNYAVLKFHYDENGVRNNTQSLFGIIDCDSSYDLDENQIDTTYWQERFVYSLDENDFEYRYSDIYDGYFLSLKLNTKQLFEEMPRAKVNININLQSDYLKSKEINLVGLDYKAFEDFEIDTLKVIGNSQTFYLLEGSLIDSNLQRLEHSNGITFDIVDGAINNEYVEVVL